MTDRQTGLGGISIYLASWAFGAVGDKNKQKLDDSVFFRTQSYITELCYFKYLPSLFIRWFMSL